MNSEIETSAHKHTVIVADNSATLRLIVKRVLEQDYHFLEAGNGAQVLSLINMTLAKESSADLPDKTIGGQLAVLIIGFELSGGHGLELIVKLREIYTKQDLPIILNTSNNRRENIKQAIEAGISDYIVKPFTAELLAAKVRNLFTHAPQQSLDLSRRVAQIPFFKDVPEQVVAHAMADCATTSELDPGSIICKQGESNFDLFILMSGKCEVFYNDQKIAEISPIESIGEMGFLEHEKRSATVVASEDSVLVTFDQEKFESFLNKDRAVSEIICKNVIHTLSDRIKKSNKLLDELKHISSEKAY